MRPLAKIVLIGFAASAPVVATSLDDARTLHRAGRLREALTAYRAVAAAAGVTTGG